MKDQEKNLPTVVLPLVEDCDQEECQDVFVYLRPESNGILVESAIMRAISRRKEIEGRIKLVYLANIPGSFLSRHRVIENYYRLKLLFSKGGKELFTPYMRTVFSRHFRTPFESAQIVGAFNAMRILSMDREELFSLWVPEQDLLHLCGQTIKRYKNLFIINYDIPAILKKNCDGTDIAVMIFRTEISPEEFHHLITDMVTILRKEGLVDARTPFSRVFHYSNGPFEQLRDGLGFLYDQKGEHLPKEKIRFYRYLLKAGLSSHEIVKSLDYPLYSFGKDGHSYTEETIYAATEDLSYQAAMEKLFSANSQLMIGAERRSPRSMAIQ
jgi:hypothetical protein